MYSPRHFRQDDPESQARLIQDFPLAQLCVIIDEQVEVAHIQVVIGSVSGDAVEAGHPENPDKALSLLFHLARANPVARALESGTAPLLVFTGPNVYVSPDWYGTLNQVPTWNYATVHVRGAARVLDDTALTTLLDILSAHGESRLDKKPWTSEKMDQAMYTSMRKAIVVFELTAQSVEGKWKMNQNRRPAERTAVREAMARLSELHYADVHDEMPE